MNRNRTWRECNQCGKKLASYKTLWQHRKTCKQQKTSNGGGGEKGILLPQKEHENRTGEGFLPQQQQQQQQQQQNTDISQQQSRSIVGDRGQEEGSNEFNIEQYTWRDRGVERNHSFLLPKKSIRAIIVGKSGFGKSTLLNYLLLHPDMLDYDTLTVCGQSLHQPEYRIMKRAFEKGLSKNQVISHQIQKCSIYP